MKPNCPHCIQSRPTNEVRNQVSRAGHFRRRSDSRVIQKFRCRRCQKYFSFATLNSCYRQKKRRLNHKLFEHMASGLSQRRAAILFHVNRTTITRKFKFVGIQALLSLEEINCKNKPCDFMQFDDMETFEHTRCKPLSITLAVEHGSRRILGFEVARMPAKGKLAAVSLRKYGPRIDERKEARERLFTRIKTHIHPQAIIASDQNPHYVSDIKKHFPQATHVSYRGRKPILSGQGELKRGPNDPLFSLNHTCAMNRANINRLFCRTWNTTKLPERLALHIAIYSVFHNLVLIDDS
jgi:hypothetical protein